GGAAETYQYDAHGNLWKTVTALGITQTFYNDAIGQTYRTDSPIDGSLVTTTRSYFDDMGRDTLRVTTAPTVSFASGNTCSGCIDQSHPGDTVTVRTSYDAEGVVTGVTRRSALGDLSWSH